MCSYLSAIMHMLLLPKKVLKIIKTKQKKRKGKQQRQQFGNRRQKLCSCPSDFLCKQKQCFSVDWRQLGYSILNLWFIVIGISDSSRDLNECLLFHGCYIYFLTGSSFFFASFSFWLLMFEILRQKVSLFYCRVLKWLFFFLRERVLAHTPLTNAWSVFLWTSTFFFR